MGTCGLNKVGTYIGQFYGEGKTVSEVVSSLCERYRISAQQAETDVRALTEKLVDKGLLQLP